MTNSISDIPDADVLLVAGSNTTEAHPVLALQMKKAVRKCGAKLILIDPRRVELSEFAHMHLRQRPGTDVAIFNAMAHVIIAEDLRNPGFISERTEGFEALKEAVSDWTPRRAAEVSGVPAEQIEQAARLYAGAKAASIFWAMGITQHTTGTDNVKVLANLALLCGHVGRPGTGLNPLRGQNNVQGACDLGGLPNVFSGYQPVSAQDVREKMADGWGIEAGLLKSTPGLTVTEMISGVLDDVVKGIFIMGENPMLSDPDLHHVEEALRAVEFLAVQDIFLNETAEFADVVLPGACFAEKNGTYTNTERRVQLVRKALDPPGEAQADWEILVRLAQRLGAGWAYEDASEVFAEMASLTPQYAGMSHARLEEGGLQWPCPSADHPGTQILHVGKFARGLGAFSPIEFKPPAELPDKAYPLYLSTGRTLFHWHGGTISRRSPGLEALAPEAEVEISPEDAEELGISDGMLVRVRSRRGEVSARSVVTPRSPPGTIFMSFHYAEAAANILTANHVDPVAKIPEYKVSAVKIEPLEKRTA